ncbi:THO complex subunit 3 [Echria macrotheca]|uniref:THO complex subunit 3 n=1 Tax=Echria macrotheca TaxID=438768 RepID=A0AAJ0F758_9PEZI|nr:THO complex subunit 3 [Echria macrotheca]
MAPASQRPRYPLAKDKFSAYFSQFKSQTYNDTSSRGPLSGHSGLRSIAWNPLGTLVATGAADKTLRVWNPEKPNVRFSTELKGHSSSVEKVEFNPVKDAELASLSSDGAVKIWDVRTKACVNEIKGLGNANALAWAPDGTSLIAGNKVRKAFLLLLEPQGQSGVLFRLSPTQSTIISTHPQPVDSHQMAFCWSGKRIFVPTRDGRTRILSYPELDPVLRLPYTPAPGESTEFMLKGHTAPCLTAELSPTGKYLATGGADSIVALFDTKDWLCQRTFSQMEGSVRSISFTYDGCYLVAGCEDNSGVHVFHTESGDVVHTFKTAGHSEAVAWAPTRYCLAYSDLGILRIVGLSSERS